MKNTTNTGDTFPRSDSMELNEATQNEVSIVQSMVPHGTGRGTGEQNQQKNDLEFSQEWLLHFFSVNEVEKPCGLLSRPGRSVEGTFSAEI